MVLLLVSTNDTNKQKKEGKSIDQAIEEADNAFNNDMGLLLFDVVITSVLLS